MSDRMKLLGALADPTRLRILFVLRENELSVAELQEVLGVGQSRISNHLSLLKGGGVGSGPSGGSEGLLPPGGGAGGGLKGGLGFCRGSGVGAHHQKQGCRGPALGSLAAARKVETVFRCRGRPFGEEVLPGSVLGSGGQTFAGPGSPGDVCRSRGGGGADFTATGGEGEEGDRGRQLSADG